MKLFDIELIDKEFDLLMCEQAKGKELKVENGKVIAYIRETTKEELKEQKIADLKQRLSQLSEDLIQSTAGEIIADIEARKAEFVKVHNELRVLLGKDERKVE